MGEVSDKLFNKIAAGESFSSTLLYASRDELITTVFGKGQQYDRSQIYLQQAYSNFRNLSSKPQKQLPATDIDKLASITRDRQYEETIMGEDALERKRYLMQQIY